MTVTPAQNGIFDDLGQRILRLRTSDADLARLPLLCLLLASLFSGLAALASARKLSIDVESVATAEAMLRTWLGEPRQPAPLSTNSAPGYPLLLAILSRLVPGLRDGLACAAERLGPCSLASLIPLLLLQVAAAIATLALAYRLARTLSNQTSVALLTVILMYFATRPGSFAGMVRGQTWLVLLLFLHVVMLSDIIQRGARLPAVTSGCALAGATLFEPLAVVLIPISTLLLALTPSARTGGAVPDRLTALIFLTTAIPALAALISLAVSLSYDGETLGRNIGLGVVQRLAFVGLKVSTALATIATSIPLFGDMIATLLPVSEVRLISPGGVEGSLVHDAVAHRWPNALCAQQQCELGRYCDDATRNALDLAARLHPIPSARLGARPLRRRRCHRVAWAIPPASNARLRPRRRTPAAASPRLHSCAGDARHQCPRHRQPVLEQSVAAFCLRLRHRLCCRRLVAPHWRCASWRLSTGSEHHGGRR